MQHSMLLQKGAAEQLTFAIGPVQQQPKPTGIVLFGEPYQAAACFPRRQDEGVDFTPRPTAATDKMRPYPFGVCRMTKCQPRLHSRTCTLHANGSVRFR